MELIILFIVIAIAIFIADLILKWESEDEISEDELHRVLIASLKREMELDEYGAPEGSDGRKS